MQSADLNLTDAEKLFISQAYKSLPIYLPTFKKRDQQRQMISQVAKSLATGTKGLIEATTGTGKSISYLIPALVVAMCRDKRLIVSTATAALQDQLAAKDVPLISKVLEKVGLGSVKCAVAKGRERYVCPYRLDGATTQSSLLEEPGANVELNQIADLWSKGSWDGLRDSLPKPIKLDLWSKINNTSNSCSGPSCPSYKDCPYFSNQKLINDANIIIANHDYVLACVTNGVTKSPVVQFDKCIYVFDEAHHIPGKAIESFATKLKVVKVPAAEILRAAAGIGAKGAALEVALSAMQGIVSALSQNLPLIAGSDSSMYRFTLGEIPHTLNQLIVELGNSATTAEKIISDAISRSERKTKLAELTLIHAKTWAGYLRDIARQCDEVSEVNALPKAKWITRFKGGWTINSAPFDAGGLLRKTFFEVAGGVILTSATLAPLGKFDSMLRQLGLDEKTACLRLSSPLNFDKAKITVPRHLPDTTDVQSHTKFVTAHIKARAIKSTDKGVLVYFSSKKQMETVYESLDERAQELILMQGQWSPTAMIEKHKERVNSGNKSILFGLDSLSEGVDLPGILCSVVMVSKLPFPSPDDPILAAHAEHLEGKGLQAFPLLMLPATSLKLAQIVGRLIRTEDDWGEVCVLDNRLIEKTYGKQLLKSTAFTSAVYC
jgi:ATP-dependent DNA helicase DinG